MPGCRGVELDLKTIAIIAIAVIIGGSMSAYFVFSNDVVLTAYIIDGNGGLTEDEEPFVLITGKDTVEDARFFYPDYESEWTMGMDCYTTNPDGTGTRYHPGDRLQGETELHVKWNPLICSADDTGNSIKYFEMVDQDDTSRRTALTKGAMTFDSTAIVNRSAADGDADGDAFYVNSYETKENDGAFFVDAFGTRPGRESSCTIAFTEVEGVEASLDKGILTIQLRGIKAGFTVSTVMLDVNNDESRYVGTWTLVGTQVGVYTNGKMTYSEPDNSGRLTIERVPGGDFYKLTFHDTVSYCLLNEEHMVTTTIGEFVGNAFIKVLDDRMSISILDKINNVAIVMQLVRTGSYAVVGMDTYPPDTGLGGFKMNKILYAFKAVEFSDKRTTDHMDRNYELTIERIEGDMVFYKVVSDADHITFVGIRIGDGDYLSIGDMGDRFLIDMVRADDEVIYTTSYSNVDGDMEIWNVCYGDRSRVTPITANLDGLMLTGTEKEIISNNGSVLENTTQSVTARFEVMDENIIQISTVTENVQLAVWGAIVYDAGDVYVMTIESGATYNGVGYGGYYVCELSKNLDRMSVIGTLNGENGDSVVFSQEYGKVSD